MTTPGITPLLKKIHPLEAVTWDLVEFWLNQIPSYKRSDAYHNPIHRELIRPRYNENGPLPSMVVLAGGERAGKSNLGAAHMFAMHWTGLTYWIVGERYEDCRTEFEYIRDMAQSTGVLATIHEPQTGPCSLTFKNGAKIVTKSSDDYTTLAGASPDGILMVEASRQPQQAFRTLWTRLTHATGWMLVSGTWETYKGSWMKDLWNQGQGANEYGCRSMCLPSYANPEVYPDGERDPKLMAIRATLTEEEFGERFLGLPRAPMGVVFPEFRRSTHVMEKAAYQPMYPIRLWIDPGYYPSSYSILFVQIVSGQIRIIKEYYTNSQLRETLSPTSNLPPLTTPDIVPMVIDDPLFGEVNRICIDIAAAAHAGAQESTVETWRRLLGQAGRAIPIRSQYVKIEDGIRRTHDKLRFNMLTKEPFLIIDKSCENTIYELEEGYTYHMRGNGDFGSMNKPVDRDNHSVKAIAYGIVDEWGISDVQLKPPEKPVRRPMFHNRLR
jgi:hypothetical protein